MSAFCIFSSVNNALADTLWSFTLENVVDFQIVPFVRLVGWQVCVL